MPESRFNGAAPMMERKTRTPAVAGDRPTSLNGAAPMMERKTSGVGSIAASACTLQWGRSDDGAENAPSLSESLGGSIEASMGPLR